MTVTTGQTQAQIRNVVTLKNLLSAQHRAELEWTEWHQPGRAGTSIHTLYTTEGDSPATAFLVRFHPGSHGDLHEHLGYELMFVLEGAMYALFPGGMKGVSARVLEMENSTVRLIGLVFAVFGFLMGHVFNNHRSSRYTIDLCPDQLLCFINREI